MYLDLYNFDNLAKLECVYAYQMHKITGIDLETCFKVKNVRDMDDNDRSIMDMIKNDEGEASLNMYNSNWRLYCVQTYDLRYVPPSTKGLIERYKEVVRHEPSFYDLHFMGNYIRNNRFNINKTYEVANTWQVMHLSKICQDKNIDKNTTNIIAFFSKIYIRKPRGYEVDMVKNISTSMNEEEVRNEIVRFVEVEKEYDFRARRRPGA